MPEVVSVSRSQTHKFSKIPNESIQLIAGEGVEGDAHRGKTVKHRSRLRTDASQVNLRQVHLIHFELIEELRRKGFNVDPATLGENITTRDIDLLALPVDTILRLGETAVLRVTGLRNPCKQLDDYQNGLTSAVLERLPGGGLIRKAGIMTIVLHGGLVVPNDVIVVEKPSMPHLALVPV